MAVRMALVNALAMWLVNKIEDTPDIDFEREVGVLAEDVRQAVLRNVIDGDLELLRRVDRGAR
jgi:hypothetical protein